MTEEQLLVYSNPSATTFNIQLDSKYSGEVIISVKNALGQIVKQESINKTNPYLENMISLEGEAKGVYFLQVQTSNGSTVRQLIKLETDK